MDARAGSACYPQSTFYLLSDGPSIRNRRITKPDFRLCLTYQSHSQAPFYLYALRLIANQAEGTFGLLRYSFGGDRPSQTAQLTLSPAWFHRNGVRTKAYSGWYFNVGSAIAGATASQPPTYPTQNKPQPNISLQSRFMGSFRLAAGTWHLHHDYNFTGSLVETVLQSLRHSCRSELTRQGTSLP